VDPENEYELLVKALGGEAIKVSVDSRTHFNPLDYHYDPKTDVPPDVAKIEFVLSMLDKLIGENGHLQPEDRSLIAASLKNIYKPLIASGYTAPCPTLGDLYRDLNKSNLRRAKQLALMLDEVCFNRLCRPVMRSLSYYTNFFDFSILRKLL
jgi:type IV secretory pathway VirB4 component